MKNIERPLDILNNSKEKEVLVQLKNRSIIGGVLKAFDIHINIVIDNASEISEGQVTKKIGTTFIRGDAILYISPSL